MDIIIGAGISGLSYANFSKNDYTIVEADAEIGGYCKTVKQDGFVWDYSGHFFHFQNKWLEEYVCSAWGGGIKEIIRRKKNTQIKYRDRYIDFPFQKNIHQLEQQEFIDCLYDLFTIPETNYVTFKQMLYAKFGKSIADKFLIPYNEKLYACDLDALDINAMGRFFPYAARDEIIRNFKKSDDTSYNSSFIYPRGGAVEYVNALYSRTDGARLYLNEKVTGIDMSGKKVQTNLRELCYDNLVSTVPFPQLLAICNVDYEKTVYSWNKVLVFNLGFDRKGEDRVNSWVYFPGKEFVFYRVGYYDNIFSDNRMSLYVELGFNKSEMDIDINRYREKTLDDLAKAGIITGQKLISSHHVLMDPAYVHITKESIADVESKKKFLSENNIYSIGRYGSWTYCSIEDNILEAKALAEFLNK